MSIDECITNCRACHEICLETQGYCLEKGDRHAAPKHQRLLQDCIQICQTSLDFLLRRSDHHGETCRACAAICEACAESCSEMKGDKQMERCADICSACAESCDQMAREMAA